MNFSTARIGSRLELWDWKSDSGIEGRFALVHGPDRRNYDDGTRRVFFRRVADIVKHAEKKQGHHRSIVVGDFNAEPFESAVVSLDGLHAVGIRQKGEKPFRASLLDKSRHPFFYNPMWRLYGHDPLQESGKATHYWFNRLAGEVFWHMIDQVVLRPGECPRFPEDKLEILTRIGEVDLLKPDGTPDPNIGSDHLPIIFHWNL